MSNVSLPAARALLGTISNPEDRAKLDQQIQAAIAAKAATVEVSWVHSVSSDESIRLAAEKGDTFTLADGPTVNLNKWLRALPLIKATPSAKLADQMAEAQGLLGTSGLSSLEQARLHLFVAGAGIELAGRNVSVKDNAVASITSLITAVKLAPTDMPVVVAYAQAMHTMAHLPFYTRVPANLWLSGTFKAGIDSREAEALSLLKKLPASPSAGVGIRVLGAHLKDPASAELAQKQLAAVPDDTVKLLEGEYAELINRTKEVKER